MYAVVRTYAGAGGKELADLLEQRKAEIDGVIRSVSGFVSYSIVRSDDGLITVTVCEDKTGTEESTQRARDWIQENAPDLGVAAPTIFAGQVVVHLS